jgi:urease accessory protein
MAFVGTMLAGFAAATLGLQIPFVEPAISSSIIILGLLVALAVEAPVWLGAAITGLFAFFHGHVHGTEATAVGLVPYAAGFAFATAALHAVGIGLGLSEGAIGKLALRTMGGLTVLGGIALIAG